LAAARSGFRPARQARKGTATAARGNRRQSQELDRGMAAGNEPLRGRRPAILAGQLALAWLALLTGGAILGLVLEGFGSADPLAILGDPHIFRVAWFTLYQAALSTVLSVLPAL